MADYIDRQKAIETFLSNGCIFVHGQSGVKAIVSRLQLIPAADVVEVVRCKDCFYAEELDKHCYISRTAYMHCSLWRGDETKNVWHKYKRYYKDYSLVELDGFCSEGRRKED